MRMAKPTMAAAFALVAAVAPATAEKITVQGETIDTWCYFSGVMGGPESVVGSAHHTCAMWCAAGGIPVGLVTEDNELYLVLKVEGDAGSNGGDTFLDLTNNSITAHGEAYERDGMKYIVVEKVVANNGIVNLNHGDLGVTPGNAIPDSVIKEVQEEADK